MFLLQERDSFWGRAVIGMRPGERVVSHVGNSLLDLSAGNPGVLPL